MFLLLIVFIYNYKYFYNIYNKNKLSSIKEIIKIEDNEIIWKKEIPIKKTKEEIKKEVKNKLDTLRKRYSYKWLIMSWDMHMNNEEYLLALKNYLEVLKWSPKDEKIILKIGDTYFEMKKFDKAFFYYSKIKKYKSLDKNKAILSMLYWKEILLENIAYFDKEIDSFDLWKDYTFYYKNTISCVNSFHKCKLRFNDYFDNNKVLIPELKNIKDAIQQYRNFQVEELYYKNTLIIASFFKYKLYSITVKLWKDILNDKPWYKPLLQIIAKSYYELWQYNFAKKYLSDYYTLDSTNKDIIYMIWVVKMKLKDYLVSNIFFDKLLKSDYKNTLDLKKNMIYNYYKLGDVKKMLNVFKEIATEKNITPWDLSLIIYYHIINKEIKYSKILTNETIKKYPKNDIFYSYLWWINKEKGDLVDAELNFKKAISLYPRNTMATFNLWLLEILKWNEVVAKIYFKNTIKVDKEGEYWLLAKKELDKLEK